MIADLYGEQRLLRQAHRADRPRCSARPATCCLRTGMCPPQSRWITVYAADLRPARPTVVARAARPHGRAVGRRLCARQPQRQRAAASRIVVRELAPLSLAPFFSDMRSALDATAPTGSPSPRTVVLSPGLGHPSYFEHSYLAAHLGYHLAEMGDLVVRHGRVWLRALSGLEAGRRAAASSRERSRRSARVGRRRTIGVPGLAQVARIGGVGIANALGSGVAGSMALLPFVPAAADVVRRGTLAADAATRCGAATAESRDEVLDDIERFVLHDLAGVGHAGRRAVRRRCSARISTLPGRTQWRTLIDTEPHRVVAQEKVTFATAPMLDLATAFVRRRRAARARRRRPARQSA